MGWLFGCLILGLIFWIAAHVHSRHKHKFVQNLSLQVLAGDTNAITQLGQIGSDIVPELIKQAHYTISPERKAIDKRIKQLPQPIGKVLGNVVGLPDDVKIREAAARAFGTLDYQAEEAIPILIYLLNDPEGNVRWEAAKSLVSIGPAAVPPLIEILDERTNTSRGMVIYALGLIGPEADLAIPALIPNLTDSDAQVRSQTAYTLSQLGPKAVIALANLTAYGNTEERKLAQEILHKMVSSPQSPILALKQLAGDAITTNRVQAMEALGNLRPATALAVKTLQAGLADADALVRAEAAQGLGKIGSKAQSALPELKKSENDPDQSVRSAAKIAIEKISAKDTIEVR